MKYPIGYSVSELYIHVLFIKNEYHRKNHNKNVSLYELNLLIAQNKKIVQPFFETGKSKKWKLKMTNLINYIVCAQNNYEK